VDLEKLAHHTAKVRPERNLKFGGEKGGRGMFRDSWMVGCVWETDRQKEGGGREGQGQEEKNRERKIYVYIER
jgi:hypothetical protein